MSRRTVLTGTGMVALCLALSAIVPISAQPPYKSINSTAQNRSSLPSTLVPEQPIPAAGDFVIVGANDLGMHCANLDQRMMSILPPFNTIHAQVIRKGHAPVVIDSSQVQVLYSAASNPQDPVGPAQTPASIYKGNFWATNPRTGNPYGFDEYNPQYPPGILPLFPFKPDIGLPVPDLQRLYFGDHQLSASQQMLPSAVSPSKTDPYVANVPQAFDTFYTAFPFFIDFPFGYALHNLGFFSAEGLPLAPFDDVGRMNPYPLMRVQAAALAGNSFGVPAGTVLTSIDVVAPVSAEVSCQTCHAAQSDGGNGLATVGKGFTVSTSHDDPLYGQVPNAFSIAYSYALNIMRLHDVRFQTTLEQSQPVQCQVCHYSPALDLAHLGPQGPGGPYANGREQGIHHSMSRAMHYFHGTVKIKGKLVFPKMRSPKGRSIATRDKTLLATCYMCHPGASTKCFRGIMFDQGAACQDCHGELAQVGNDFSGNVSSKNPGAFVVRGDFYTNPKTPRIPWANEPTCGSCHTGDALSNLAGKAGTVKSPDGMTLLQAYRSNDKSAKPIVAANRRFAENQVSDQNGTRQVLYRLSTGHGGVLCEGCHGSTHAEWPNAHANANDNVAPTQVQGYSSMLMDCQSCHGANAFTIGDFIGNFDANGLMKGPHGMHPAADATWNRNHSEVYNDPATPKGLCTSCHGKNLQGTVLSRTPVARTLLTDEGTIRVQAGTAISCTLCHEKPGPPGSGG